MVRALAILWRSMGSSSNDAVQDGEGIWRVGSRLRAKLIAKSGAVDVPQSGCEAGSGRAGAGGGG
jgi:hypothetical protein